MTILRGKNDPKKGATPNGTTPTSSEQLRPEVRTAPGDPLRFMIYNDYFLFFVFKPLDAGSVGGFRMGLKVV